MNIFVKKIFAGSIIEVKINTKLIYKNRSAESYLLNINNLSLN